MESFNSWIRDNGLDDIQVDNMSYIWSNKRSIPTLVHVDRVLVNAEWNLGFLQASATSVPATTSDHAPLLVHFSSETYKSNLFRMESHWLEMEETRQIIFDGWSKGSRTFRSSSSLISFKMRRVRAALRQWCRNRASLRVLIDNNKHVVSFLNAVEKRRSLSPLEMVLREFATAKADQLILWQTASWRRRAKVRWCVSGDENYKFFHAATNCQARRNKIKVIVHEGVEHYQNSQKLALATNYFSTLLGQEAVSLPAVHLNDLYTPLDLSGLAVGFTWAEIVRFVDRSPNNRSPGSDGFTSEFYKAFKHLLKTDLLKFFNDFFSNNVSLDDVNTAFITLLPKKDTPLELRDFRPISLVHSLPKLVTKVLAIRLQSRIPELVHALQSGFLRGRSIIENFALAVEMVQCAHKRKLPMIALKLYFQKAFDSVSWDCLSQVLEARGFPQIWIQWITKLLSTGRSRVLVNGELGDPILAKKGFWLGDPLSPYLFILVADVLQQLCCMHFQAGNLLHPLGSDTMFPVLQYADDTLILFRVEVQ